MGLSTLGNGNGSYMRASVFKIRFLTETTCLDHEVRFEEHASES